MNALNQLLSSLKIEANVHHNGQYCGDWAVDISGSKRMTFHVISKGRCYLEYDGQSIALETGDAVFMPCDAQHCVTSLPNANLEVNQSEALPMTQSLEQESTGLVCGNFAHQHPVFERLVQQMPNFIVVRASEGGPTKQIVDLLIQESLASGQHSNVLLNRLADCLFYLLVKDNLNINSGVFAAFVHPNLSAAMELMQTPIEYITQWRMTQAYRWLADDGISTFDAALRCGYESEASFAKAFKRVMGVGPGFVRAAGSAKIA